MKKAAVDKLIRQGARASTDTKNPQPRQVIATAGKLRIQVGKGKPTHGKTNN